MIDAPGKSRCQPAMPCLPAAERPDVSEEDRKAMASDPREPFSKAEIESMRRAARDEAGVISDFWDRFRRIGSKLPFAEELVAAYVCATDDGTPARVKLTLLGALAYFVMPFDAVPDFLPLMGFTDDAAVLAAAIATVGAHMTDFHRARAREILGTRAIDG
jgi:uncharacterized membrane protein YkvA (DUF1232 family)